MQIGFSKKISEVLIDEIISIMIDNLIRHKKLKLSNFGTFFVRNKKKRIGRNPITKEEKIINSRNVILFKASTDFKSKVNIKKYEKI